LGKLFPTPGFPQATPSRPSPIHVPEIPRPGKISKRFPAESQGAIPSSETLIEEKIYGL
jgi:hypothetical protein